MFSNGEFVQVDKEARMTRTGKTVLVASIALAFGLIDIRPTLAGCGGYCKARQARAICHRAVALQGLEARERDAEFEKCKADRLNYAVDPALGDSETGLE
jgi:hypothetical protein